MTDVPLLRNKSGTARDRDPKDSADELEIESAIGHNVRLLRQQQGLTVAEMATRVGISKAMMSKIENAQTSCSLSTLALLAKGLDVPVTSLFRGSDVERPAAFVKAGTGARIVRNGTREGHEYQLLGSLRGEHKRLECLMVTLSEKSQTYPLFQHPGTEFIYMLEGVMDYSHSRSVYRLEAGDSLQFDGEGAHGPADLVQCRSGSCRWSRSPTRRCRSGGEQLGRRARHIDHRPTVAGSAVDHHRGPHHHVGDVHVAPADRPALQRRPDEHRRGTERLVQIDVRTVEDAVFGARGHQVDDLRLERQPHRHHVGIAVAPHPELALIRP